MDAAMRIGELARRTDTTVATIRYYEEIGLLCPAARQSGGQRTYGFEDVSRLTFVRRCRAFDLSIDDIRSLLVTMQNDRSSCSDARDLAQVHLERVRNRILDLTALEKSLASMIRACDANCAGGSGPDCVIFEEIGAAASLAASRSSAAG